jgi:hypothetical protein
VARKKEAARTKAVEKAMEKARKMSRKGVIRRRTLEWCARKDGYVS